MPILITFLLAVIPLQDEGVSIYEAKFFAEKELKGIPGAKRLSIGGIGEKRHIIVQVDSPETGDKVREKIGETFRGWPVHISIFGTGKPAKKEKSPVCADCTCPCHKGGRTIVEAPKPATEEACDILRRMLGKKRRKGKSFCQQMIGWTNDRKKIESVKRDGLPNWPSKEFGMPGVLAYTYIKHRRECPLAKKAMKKKIGELTPRESDR